MDYLKRLAVLGLVLVLTGMLICSADHTARPVSAEEETPQAEKTFI